MDIVERLRYAAQAELPMPLFGIAADEIERLRKDVEMYKKIMRELHKQARAETLREAADKVPHWYTGMDFIYYLRRMADEVSNE